MSVLQTTLVLGGARSGKSQHAERLVTESGLAPVYIATGSAGDGEMADRIRHHRDRRGPEWRTIEEPLDLVGALRRIYPSSSAPSHTAILVDCLTFWLFNLMEASRDIAQDSADLGAALRELSRPVVLVSNEVGMGLVPETPLGRRFRDEQGRLNQAVAAAVPSCIFVAAGLPLVLKAPTAG